MRRVLAIAAVTVLLPGLAIAQGTSPQGGLPPGPPHGGPPGSHAPPPPGPRAGPPGPPPGATFRPGPVGPVQAGPPGGPVHVGPPSGQEHVSPPGATVPVGGPVGPGQFMFRGHPFNRVHVAPFVYPLGFAYRRWAAGAVLPPLFLVPAYYYADWATLGLEPPPPDAQWVRYGPDLLLVDVNTGEVLDVAYGAFDD